MRQDLNTAMDKMTALNAWELEANAKAVLERVGIHNPGMMIAAMSGGQARKVAVAAALLGSPDVLILDEPTNHMDVQVSMASLKSCFRFQSAAHLPGSIQSHHAPHKSRSEAPD